MIPIFVSPTSQNRNPSCKRERPLRPQPLRPSCRRRRRRSRHRRRAPALCDRLLGQDEDGGPKVEVVPQIDARLAEQETDGWRYADMPEDGKAWRDSLRFLDEDSQAACSRELAGASLEDQRADAAHVWSLWTRYACAAVRPDPDAPGLGLTLRASDAERYRTQ